MLKIWDNYIKFSKEKSEFPILLHSYTYTLDINKLKT